MLLSFYIFHVYITFLLFILKQISCIAKSNEKFQVIAICFFYEMKNALLQQKKSWSSGMKVIIWQIRPQILAMLSMLFSNTNHTKKDENIQFLVFCFSYSLSSMARTMDVSNVHQSYYALNWKSFILLSDYWFRVFDMSKCDILYSTNLLL